MSSYDLVITDGRCAVTDKSQSLRWEITDIAVKNGIIQDIGPGLAKKAKTVIDAKNLTVLPGAIDSQVHFREPGLTHKEDLYTGSMSAIAGGITSFFEMPNTKPNTSTAEKLQEKLNLAASKAKCDFAFFMGATAENTPHIAELEKLPGCSGIKIFMGSSTGDLLVSDDETLEKIFKNGSRRIAVHCEDEFILRDRKSIADQSGRVQDHPVWRNEDSALSATRRILNIAEKTQRPVHVLHVSTAEEMAFLKHKKQWATVECLPQFLTLHAPDCYDRLGTLAQMNPPVREKHHQEALWKAIADGTVDVIGSDHAPHTREEKALPYPQSPSGMTGVQTLLPLMLNHVNNNKLSLERLIELICINPARIYGAHQKGQIAVGKDADLTIVDMKASRMISNSWIQSKVGWTPFDGMTVKGWPKKTIVRGQLAMEDDVIFTNVVGKAVEFGPSTFRK
ncbi:MAG: dihydroorotase [Bdellovibrionales bacterium]|nr:dihydroorotase [Bdellovibrionales bacterium]